MARGPAAVVAVAAVGALMLGACSSGQPEAQEGPTDRAVSAECRQAFADVSTEAPDLAQPGPTAPPSPVPVEQPGAFVDLYGTVTACGSVTEWTEAFRGARLTITRNADPVSTVRSLCRNADDEEVVNSAICREVEVPSAVDDVEGNDADLDATETPGG